MKFLKGYRKLFLVAALVIGLSFLIVHIVQAVTTTPPDPGSDSDPIVSQSYVDTKVGSITTTMNEVIAKANDLSTSRDSLVNSLNQLTTNVADLTNKVNNSAAEDTTQLSKEVAELSAKVDQLTSIVNNMKAPAEPQYQLYKLLKGKQMIPAPGTEIIIRTGMVRTVKGKNGNLLDLTSGTEISSTGNLPFNRLLLAHMDDGRGIKALADSWVLVKGSYNIK